VIIARGPLFKQRGYSAYREVISQIDGKYVVHSQFFPHFPDLARFYFGLGGYCCDKLDITMRRFAARITTHAECVPAIEETYRLEGFGE